jgi:hypothetical protein
MENQNILKIFLLSKLRMVLIGCLASCGRTLLDPYGISALTMNEIELGRQVAKFVNKMWHIIGFSKITFSL